MAVEQQVGEASVLGIFRGPAAYVARTPWGPFSALLAAIIIVALGIISGLLLIFWGGITPAPPSSSGQWDISTLFILGTWQVTVIILVLLASARGGGTISSTLALRPPAGGARVYVIAPLLMLALQVVVGIVQYNLTDRDIYVDLRPFVGFAKGSQWPLALAIIGLGAPLSEELLIRGFLLSALARSRLGFAGAALVTTTIWAGLHAGYSTVGLAEVFLIGLFFSWLLWRTGSLRVTIFCHALYNSLVLLTLRFAALPSG
ncbi:MAG TPA: type II CAAX endopeptidase family protein [Hyphomicrobiaceae bacterium]|nr:type II CAAX endopeptidase family protein [Hyphomicrobiaceae bacterium]